MKLQALSWGFMDRREHHRVQLRLPARLRWTTPLGQKTEVCETMNVSRGGLLVPCQEPHAEGMSLWVTFPYDAGISYGQPEISAKVVRFVGPAALEVHGFKRNRSASSVVGGPDGEDGAADASMTPDATSQVTEPHHRGVAALRFEITPRHRPSGNSNGHRRSLERRASTRQQLAVPIQVRPEHVPWFEQTMTIDCSAEGLKFRSNREYSFGQYLVISFENADTSPWRGTTESVLMVARIERVSQSPALNVGVCRSRQFSLRF